MGLLYSIFIVELGHVIGRTLDCLDFAESQIYIFDYSLMYTFFGMISYGFYIGTKEIQ